MKATSLHNPCPARRDDPDERLAITPNGGSRLNVHSKLVVAVGGRTSWTYLLVGADVELVA